MREWLRKKSCAAVAKVKAAWECERGDTNFISILIVLGVVIALAGVFLGFQEQIVGKVQEIINGFKYTEKLPTTT